mmetsp:Transcript_31632/g.75870  ORF Transcript_31632/g.75870 Transcript_31632/m.75870 type:complete len:369 (-) Transcript_31632:679-1785(-)
MRSATNCTSVTDFSPVATSAMSSTRSSVNFWALLAGSVIWCTVSIISLDFASRSPCARSSCAAPAASCTASSCSRSAATAWSFASRSACRAAFSASISCCSAASRLVWISRSAARREARSTVDRTRKACMRGPMRGTPVRRSRDWASFTVPSAVARRRRHTEQLAANRFAKNSMKKSKYTTAIMRATSTTWPAPQKRPVVLGSPGFSATRPGITKYHAVSPRPASPSTRNRAMPTRRAELVDDQEISSQSIRPLPQRARYCTAIWRAYSPSEISTRSRCSLAWATTSVAASRTLAYFAALTSTSATSTPRTTTRIRLTAAESHTHAYRPGTSHRGKAMVSVIAAQSSNPEMKAKIRKLIQFHTRKICS